MVCPAHTLDKKTKKFTTIKILYKLRNFYIICFTGVVSDTKSSRERLKGKNCVDY